MVDTELDASVYDQGADALNKGCWQDAISYFRLVRRSSRFFGAASANMAQALLHLGKYANVEIVYNEAIEHFKHNEIHDPGSFVLIHRVFGDARARQGCYKEASDLFNRTVQLADHFQEKGEIPEEIAAFHCASAFSSWGVALMWLEDIEMALDVFQRALEETDLIVTDRTKWRILKSSLLNNYSIILRQANKKLQAEYVLREVITLTTGFKLHEGEMHRARVGLIQLGSLDCNTEESISVLIEAAEFSKQKKVFGIAHNRFCILADYARGKGKFLEAKAALDEALMLESNRDFSSINIPRRTTLQASILLDDGESTEEIAAVLTEGAAIWHDHLDKPRTERDLIWSSNKIHDHFRMLSRQLLSLDKKEEALIAFEFGRAITYTSQLSDSTHKSMLECNPFTSFPINTSILDELRIRIRPDNVVLSIGFIPREIVAFIIGRDFFDYIAVDVGTNSDSEILIENLEALPTALEHGGGISVIPQKIQVLAESIVISTAGKKITTIAPHMQLHLVPWRTLFRYKGKPWTEITASISIGLLPLFFPRESRNNGRIASVTAMGFGFADNGLSKLDLTEETLLFAGHFKDRASINTDCSSTDLKCALSNENAVYISCHGKTVGAMDRKDVALNLCDGWYNVGDLLPVGCRPETVILSACESGVYDSLWADYPVGAAPTLIKLGAIQCLGSRWELGAEFALRFFDELGRLLATGMCLKDALSEVSATLENGSYDIFTDLGCIELISTLL